MKRSFILLLMMGAMAVSGTIAQNLPGKVKAKSARQAKAQEQLVTLPEGVSSEDYTMTISQYAYAAEGMVNVGGKRTVQVAFDGQDVYVSGLAFYFRDSYVKGTLNAQGQYVFETGQFVGSDESGNEYLNGYSYTNDGMIITDYIFDYNAETRTLTLNFDYTLGETDARETMDVYTQIYSASFTPGALNLPDVVTPPEGIETATWYLTGYNSYGSVESEVQVAFEGSDIYVQGIYSYMPEAWVKGTVSDDKATFASGQFLGLYYSTTEIYFLGADADYNVKDVVFDYDAANGKLTTTDYAVFSSDGTLNSITEYYMDLEIACEKPAAPEAIVAPEGLETMEYGFVADEMQQDYETGGYSPVPYVSYVLIGFDGQDVYFQNLSQYTPEGWAKGKLSDDGKTITIPANQYVGSTGDEYYHDDYFVTATNDNDELLDIVFDYDAATGRLTTQQTVCVNSAAKRLFPFLRLNNVVITKKTEVAATPADPKVAGFSGLYSYYNVHFDIPATGTQGEDLLTTKLSYKVWIEKDGVEQVLVFTPEDYAGLESEMEEIPYNFKHGWDIYTKGTTIVLNQGDDELLCWTKIGIQSIYRGGGQENTSGIDWFDLATYYRDNGIVGIESHELRSEDNGTWYNLNGQRVERLTKGGLYIRNGKKVMVR